MYIFIYLNRNNHRLSLEIDLIYRAYKNIKSFFEMSNIQYCHKRVIIALMCPWLVQ